MMMTLLQQLRYLVILLLSTTFIINVHCSATSPEHTTNNNNTPKNVAIILQASAFFHNYRHTTNALTIYHSLKHYGGYDDEHIILFMADEIACNARNPYKDGVYTFGYDATMNLYDNYYEHDDNEVGTRGGVQVDYYGEDVTVENFERVLLGRHLPNTPPNQKLPPATTNNSNNNIKTKPNLMIFMTGHGGDGFFKFRDSQELTSQNLRNVLEETQYRKLFDQVLVIADTCQAFTMAPNTEEMEHGSSLQQLTPPLPSSSSSSSSSGSTLREEQEEQEEDERMYSTETKLKNVYSIGSSIKNQNSYAHHSDHEIGHSVQDRYTHQFMNYMGGLPPSSSSESASSKTTRTKSGGNKKWKNMNRISVKEALVDSMYTSYGQSLLGADIGWSDYNCDRKMNRVALSEFFVMKKELRGKDGKKIQKKAIEAIGGEDEDDNGDVRVLKEEDGVDFYTTHEYHTATSSSSHRNDNNKEEGNENAVTVEERDENDAQGIYEPDKVQKSSMLEGTNPTDPIFLISMVTLVAVVHYSSSFLV